MRLFSRQLILICLIICSAVQAQSDKQVSGAFEQIKAIGKVKIKLIADDKNYAVPTGTSEENDNVTLSFSGNELKIQAVKFWKGDYINVEVHYKNLSLIDLNAGAQAYASSRISVKNLEILASEGSNFDGDVECDLLSVKSGQGSNVVLSGTADSFNASTNTGGIVSADETFAKVCSLTSNTGSEITVKGCNTMQAKAGTGAKIYYHLKPETINKKTNTGGEVELIK